MVKERFYKTEVVPRCLTFKRPAGTSRGVYTTRKLWEVRIRKEDEPSVIGIGECAPPAGSQLRLWSGLRDHVIQGLPRSGTEGIC